MKLLKYFGIVLLFILTLFSVNATTTTTTNLIFNDDFEDGSLNLSKWDKFGSDLWSETSGELRASGGTGWNSVLATDNTFTRIDGNILNGSCYVPVGGSGGNKVMFGFHDSGTGSSYTDMVHSFYCDMDTSARIDIYEDGTQKGTYVALDSSYYDEFVDFKIVLKSTGADYYYKKRTSSTWILHYNSTYSSESNLKIGYAYNKNLLRSYEVNYYNETITTGAVITINNPQDSTYYNSTTQLINITTDINTNLTYSLNGASNISLCYNCNSSQNISISAIDNSLNNLTIFSDYNGEITSESVSFTIDTNAPNISIIGNLSQDFVTNFSQIFNVTDALSGLASCTIDITYLENVTNASQYDKFVNCTDTTTFGAAGLYNGFIEAYDVAGNLATLSINGTIEVFVYLNFFDENASAITNYSAIIYHPDSTIEYVYNTSNPIELSPYHDDLLDIGTYTITFDKFGYDLYNVSVTINETSGGISYNYSVPGALIQVSVYDINDFSLITGSNTTIEIIGDSFSQVYTTSTGVLNITSLEMREETYNVIISNNNYETSTISFNFNNQEIIDVDAYLTPLELNDTLIADLVIRVFDDYQTPLRSINVIQYVWDSGQSRYVQANLKATDYNGETSFKVFLNTKLYNFCAEYLGVQYCENDLSININTEEVVIEIPISELAVADEDTIYDVDFSYSLTNSTYESGGINYTSVTFSYSNPNQDVDQYCLKIYQVSNLQRSLVANQCDTSHSGGLSVNIVENTSNTYVAVATIQVGDSIRELDSLYLYEQFDIQDELDLYGFVKIIILAIAAFIIGIALHKKVHNIYIAHFGLPIAFLIFSLLSPNYITFESFVLVALVNLFAYKVATQKDDLQREAKFTTLNSILALYMIFIFGLFTALTEIDSKGMLDDYGQVILDNIEDDNSYFNSYMDTTIDNLKTKRADANTGAWDLLTGIFLKTLEFVDTFFSILSNLFSIATNIGLIVGIKNALLLKFIKMIDYIIVAYVLYLYFKEAFK